MAKKMSPEIKELKLIISQHSNLGISEGNILANLEPESFTLEEKYDGPVNKMLVLSDFLERNKHECYDALLIVGLKRKIPDILK